MGGITSADKRRRARLSKRWTERWV